MYEYNELYHHGIKGMKWGVRRYQNADGSLTPAGKKRANSLVDTTPRRKPYSKDGDGLYNKSRVPADAKSGPKSKNTKPTKEQLVKNAKDYKDTFDHKFFMNAATDALLQGDTKLYQEIIEFDVEQGKRWADGYFSAESYARQQK